MLEIEPDKNSIFEDQALRLVLSFWDLETKDKLLYHGYSHYKVMPDVRPISMDPGA